MLKLGKRPSAERLSHFTDNVAGEFNGSRFTMITGIFAILEATY